MPQIINTNIASLNAQRNLNSSQMSLNSALQRLSSGLRINSAKDDAAGLAISERMSSQVRGLNQAVRNSNDAISLSQTAEGNLAEIGNLLQRMREIAVQSANDTNTSSDRTSLQTEVTQLTEEVDRIATSAQFNGKSLLDGTFTASSFQVGANAGQTIAFSISSAKTVDLGVGGIATATGVQATPQTAYAYTTAALTLNVTGGTVATISAQTDDGVSYVAGGRSGSTSALSMAQAINRQTGTTSIVAKAQTVRQSATMSTYAALVSGDLKINGIDIGAVTAGTSTATQAGNVVAAINAKSTQTGVVAIASATGYTLEAADGRNIDITHTTPLDKSAYTGQNVTSAAPAQTYYGTLTLTAGKAITVAGGAGHGLTAGTYALIGTTVDVSTQNGASTAITSIDSALATVNTQRATLGAVQNRFDSVIANLQSSSENLSAARSRIRDADFAAETASLTRGQIMQQAGVAMLAQANSLPNNVLSLLK